MALAIHHNSLPDNHINKKETVIQNKNKAAFE